MLALPFPCLCMLVLPFTDRCRHAACSRGSSSCSEIGGVRSDYSFAHTWTLPPCLQACTTSILEIPHRDFGGTAFTELNSTRPLRPPTVQPIVVHHFAAIDVQLRAIIGASPEVVITTPPDIEPSFQLCHEMILVVVIEATPVPTGVVEVNTGYSHALIWRPSSSFLSTPDIPNISNTPEVCRKATTTPAHWCPALRFRCRLQTFVHSITPWSSPSDCTLRIVAFAAGPLGIPVRRS